MELKEAARALQAEIDAALEDFDALGPETRVLSVSPPADAGPDTRFMVTVRIAGDRRRAELPTGLALAYLADEEAAVDEWKRWVDRLRQSPGDRSDPP